LAVGTSESLIDLRAGRVKEVLQPVPYRTPSPTCRRRITRIDDLN